MACVRGFLQPTQMDSIRHLLQSWGDWRSNWSNPFLWFDKKRIAEDVEPTINWATEKLLKIDPIQRCMSYEIVDNNMGFKSYVATVKVLSFPNNICGDGKSLGCMIEWECVCDPVEGWTLQDLNYFVGSIFWSMANKFLF